MNEPGDIQGMYERRFPPERRGAKAAVWGALVRGFFQRRIDAQAIVLDLGCGFGEFLSAVSCRRKIGVDLNTDGAAGLAPDVEFHAGSVCDLSFLPDASVDFVFTSNLMEHLSGKAEAGADVVCASRYVKGGRQIGGPWFKGMLSRFAGLSLHWLAGLPARDPTNSFKAYRRDFLARTPIESTVGFCLALELTVKAHFSGGKVVEVPACWRDRQSGKSRFRLWAWLPHYLKWYFAAIRWRFTRRRFPVNRSRR